MPDFLKLTFHDFRDFPVMTDEAIEGLFPISDRSACIHGCCLVTRNCYIVKYARRVVVPDLSSERIPIFADVSTAATL